MNKIYLYFDISTSGYLVTSLDIMSVLALICGIMVIIYKNPIISVLFLIGLFFSIACYLIFLGITFIGISYLLVYVGAVSILFIFILMLINIRISELSSETSNSLPLAIFSIIAIIFSINGTLYKDEKEFLSRKVLNIDRNINNFSYKLITPIDQTTDTDISVYQNDYINIQAEKGLKGVVPLGNIHGENYIKIEESSGTAMFHKQENIFYVTSKAWDANLAENNHITTIGNVIYTNYSIWIIITSIILLLAMVGAIVITLNPSSER